jgi:hypothetical protein
MSHDAAAVGKGGGKRDGPGSGGFLDFVPTPSFTFMQSLQLYFRDTQTHFAPTWEHRQPGNGCQKTTRIPLLTLLMHLVGNAACVCGTGFSPTRVLPCVLDVGTNNEHLRNDPLYVGLHQPRLTGEAYMEIVDEVRHLSLQDYANERNRSCKSSRFL